MTNSVMNTKYLPEILFRLITTEKVRVHEVDGVIQLTPVEDTFVEPSDCTVGLRGMLADDPEMSVEKFLERKHAEKELDL